MHKRGFTLIELLVVISIIALLIGILLPALGKARRRGQAMQSLSNVRQWGVGSLLFADDHDDFLAWDGQDSPADSSATPYGPTYNVPFWWANALPPYVQQPGFLKLTNTPLPGGEPHIFVDPAAEVPTGAPYPVTVNGVPRTFFFCYVPNSKLDSDAPLVDGIKRIKTGDLKKTSTTVLMLEKRTVKNELPPSDPYYSKSLDRCKADWQRFAARHDKGGHILFGDGHGDEVKNADAVEMQTRDYIDGSAPGWNQPDLIWNPLGRAN